MGYPYEICSKGILNIGVANSASIYKKIRPTYVRFSRERSHIYMSKHYKIIYQKSSQGVEINLKI